MADESTFQSYESSSGSFAKCKAGEMGRWFVTETRMLVGLKGAPLLVSYCCNIYDTKDASAARYGMAVKRNCAK